jgi:hypothetical protein
MTRLSSLTQTEAVVTPVPFELFTQDAVAWLQNQPAESVDLLITDPAYESLEKHRAIGTTTRLKHSKSSSNDWFKIFPNARFREVYRVLKGDTHFHRCIDIFCVGEDSQKAFAIECKFQDSQGTVDEKIPYALDDLRALPMVGCIAYAGQGFSDGVRHMLAASRHAAYCLPTVGQTETSPSTVELDHVLAVHFGWWDVLVEKKKPV